MANFRTHVTTSTVLGCGYAAAGAMAGVPIETSLVAGGLCGVSGMLPDIDSDSGIPLRESMSFMAAVVPMLLVDRLQTLGLSYDGMVLCASGIYFFIRFGVARLIARFTVHRGMFHSIPAALIFSGLAFMMCGCLDLRLRYFKAGGVFLGFMSHLILDEIYSVEWKRGRWNLKSSAGTAVKFWGDNGWANLSCYAKLLVVAVMILGEPEVMDRLATRNPELAHRLERYTQRLEVLPEAIRSAERQMWSPGATQPGIGQPAPGGFAPNRSDGVSPPITTPPAEAGVSATPNREETIYDSAKRWFGRFWE